MKIGPHHSIMARFTSTGHDAPVWAASFIDDTSYFFLTSSGNARSRTK